MWTCIWKFVLLVGIFGIPAFPLGEWIPRKWFDPVKPPFRPWKWEKDGRIYEKIRIRSWKDRVPDMSRYMAKAFPKRMTFGRDRRKVEQLVLETCSAELVHMTLIVLSPIFWIVIGGVGGFLGMVLYILGNLVSYVIQRYNRPRFLAIVRKMERISADKHA